MCQNTNLYAYNSSVYRRAKNSYECGIFMKQFAYYALMAGINVAVEDFSPDVEIEISTKQPRKSLQIMEIDWFGESEDIKLF